MLAHSKFFHKIILKVSFHSLNTDYRVHFENVRTVCACRHLGTLPNLAQRCKLYIATLSYSSFPILSTSLLLRVREGGGGVVCPSRPQARASTGHQSITSHTHTHTVTPRGNWDAFNYGCFGVKLGKLHVEATKPSCCGATVLTSAPCCPPAHHVYANNPSHLIVATVSLDLNNEKKKYLYLQRCAGLYF